MRSLLLAALLAAVSGMTFAQEPQRAPVARSHYFVFYSDFSTNLNDALINAGLARTRHKPELFQSGEEAACFAKQPASTRAAWDSAVDYYAKIISPARFFERPQFLIRMQLAGFDDELKDADPAREKDNREFVALAGHFRSAAAPAYLACRWPAQDAANRRWIDQLQPRLGKHERSIAARLEQLYQMKWTPPNPVDVVQTVDWSGANSIIRSPGSGHILVAVENPERSALEVVFHEGSHLLMGREAPVQQALKKAAEAAGRKLPGDLWHVVLFYTTGEVVRRELAREDPDYTPMLYGIFARDSWTEDRGPLESAWLPYVRGERSLDEAASALVAAIPQQHPSAAN